MNARRFGFSLFTLAIVVVTPFALAAQDPRGDTPTWVSVVMPGIVPMVFLR